MNILQRNITFLISAVLSVILPLPAVLYINVCSFICNFRLVINFNYVSSPTFQLSQNVILISVASVSKF